MTYASLMGSSQNIYADTGGRDRLVSHRAPVLEEVSRRSSRPVEFELHLGHRRCTECPLVPRCSGPSVILSHGNSFLIAVHERM